MEDEFTLKKYDSIDEILYASFAIDYPDIDSEEFKKSDFGGTDQNENEVKFTYQQHVDGIKEQGYWGWVSEDKVIHYWVGKKVPIEELIHFFGHEIGHQTGIQIKDDFQEEMRAEGYGHAAVLAYKFATEINNQIN